MKPRATRLLSSQFSRISADCIPAETRFANLSPRRSSAASPLLRSLQTTRSPRPKPSGMNSETSPLESFLAAKTTGSAFWKPAFEKSHSP